MSKPFGRLIDQIRKEDPIVKYGDPVLREVSKPLTQFSDDLPEFVQQMEQIHAGPQTGWGLPRRSLASCSG